MDGQITNVFITQDKKAVAIEVADGDGGIFVFNEGYLDVEETDHLDGDWISLGAGDGLGR